MTAWIILAGALELRYVVVLQDRSNVLRKVKRLIDAGTRPDLASELLDGLERVSFTKHLLFFWRPYYG